MRNFDNLTFIDHNSRLNHTRNDINNTNDYNDFICEEELAQCKTNANLFNCDTFLIDFEFKQIYIKNFMSDFDEINILLLFYRNVRNSYEFTIYDIATNIDFNFAHFITKINDLYHAYKSILK